MSDASPTNPSVSLLQSLVDQIDAACDRFEATWRSGREPRIEEFLDLASQTGRGELFYELLLVDLHWRSKRQESPAPDDYARRFPDFGRQIKAAFANRLPSPFGEGAGGG